MSRSDEWHARAAPSGGDAALLDVMGWQPASLEQLVSRSGFTLGVVAVALANLEAAGWITSRAGWYERIARAES